uniref:Envelope glycoprotein E n=1 Tax=Human herpesvirus 3 TaxID=10335 RepID=A0A4D6F420_HHV3|nr:ORF68 [Human alphaherpesvirus 3]
MGTVNKPVVGVLMGFGIITGTLRITNPVRASVLRYDDFHIDEDKLDTNSVYEPYYHSDHAESSWVNRGESSRKAYDHNSPYIWPRNDYDGFLENAHEHHGVYNQGRGIDSGERLMQPTQMSAQDDLGDDTGIHVIPTLNGDDRHKIVNVDQRQYGDVFKGDLNPKPQGQRLIEVSVEENHPFTLRAPIQRIYGVRYTETWSFLPSLTCTGDAAPAIQHICLKHTTCFQDVVVDVDCAENTKEDQLAEISYRFQGKKEADQPWIVVNTSTLFDELELDPPEIEPGVLKVLRTEKQYLGVYIWNMRGSDGTSTYATFLVTWKGDEKTRNPTPAVTPQPRGAEFHMWNYHSHVFSVGDTFSLAMHLQYKIHEAPFDLLLEWLYVPIDPTCQPMRLYSTCLYHPNAPQCLSHMNSGCTFTSPHLAQRVASTVYQNCEHADNYTAYCLGISHMEPSFGLILHDGGTTLKFVDTPESLSGLYVFVVYFNGHVEAVAYTVVSTVDHFVNAIEERGFPPTAGQPPATTKPKEITPVNPGTSPLLRYAAWTGGLAAVVLLCLVIFLICTAKRMRVKAYRVDKSPYNQSMYYAGLPVDDFEDSESTDTEEEFGNAIGGSHGGSSYTVYIDKTR